MSSAATSSMSTEYTKKMAQANDMAKHILEKIKQIKQTSETSGQVMTTSKATEKTDDKKELMLKMFSGPNKSTNNNSAYLSFQKKKNEKDQDLLEKVMQTCEINAFRDSLIKVLYDVINIGSKSVRLQHLSNSFGELKINNSNSGEIIVELMYFITHFKIEQRLEWYATSLDVLIKRLQDPHAYHLHSKNSQDKFIPQFIRAAMILGTEYVEQVYANRQTVYHASANMYALNLIVSQLLRYAHPKIDTEKLIPGRNIMKAIREYLQSRKLKMKQVGGSDYVEVLFTQKGETNSIRNLVHTGTNNDTNPTPQKLLELLNYIELVPQELQKITNNIILYLLEQMTLKQVVAAIRFVPDKELKKWELLDILMVISSASIAYGQIRYFLQQLKKAGYVKPTASQLQRGIPLRDWMTNIFCQTTYAKENTSKCEGRAFYLAQRDILELFQEVWGTPMNFQALAKPLRNIGKFIAEKAEVIAVARFGQFTNKYKTKAAQIAAAKIYATDITFSLNYFTLGNALELQKVLNESDMKNLLAVAGITGSYANPVDIVHIERQVKELSCFCRQIQACMPDGSFLLPEDPSFEMFDPKTLARIFCNPNLIQSAPKK
jgi:hypothetical protein